MTEVAGRRRRRGSAQAADVYRPASDYARERPTWHHLHSFRPAEETCKSLTSATGATCHFNPLTPTVAKCVQRIV